MCICIHIYIYTLTCYIILTYVILYDVVLRDVMLHYKRVLLGIPERRCTA